MYPRKRIQNIAAVSAVLFLVLSGGVFAYATRTQLSPGRGPSPLDGGDQQLQFRLVPVPVQVGGILNFRNGSGDAVIQGSGRSIQFEAGIVGATPNASITVALSLQTPDKPASVLTWNLKTGSDGNADLSASSALDSGSYLVGIKVFDASDFGVSTLILVSDPASAILTISDQASSSSSYSSTASSESSHTTTTTTTTTQSETSTQKAGGGVVYFSFVAAPLPNPAPANYLFGHGSARVGFQDSTLGVQVGIEGANPDTQYTVLLIVDGTTYPVGSVKAGDQGEFKLETTLSLTPGSYKVGLIVEDVSTFGTPITVLVSSPTFQTISQTITTTTTTTSTEGGGIGRLSFNLNPVNVQDAPSVYHYGHGKALIEYKYTSARVMVSIDGANPNTKFSIVLTVNGTNSVLGIVTTGDEGLAGLETDLSLGPGTYSVGFIVQDTSSFNAPTTVMVSDPATDILVLNSPPISSTSSTSTTSTLTTTSATPGTLYFHLIPVTVSAAPASYTAGHGIAGVKITPQGSLVVGVELEGMSTDTQYGVVLTANGTAYHLGYTDTGEKGSATFVADLLLAPGTYQIGFLIQDTSSFSSPTTVLVSNPKTASMEIFQSVVTTTTGPKPPPNIFHLDIIPVTHNSSSTPYLYGQGTAEIAVRGPTVYFGVQVYKANPNTQYTVEAIVNGSTVILGNTVTRNDGWGKILAAINVNPGTYQVGLVLVDPRTFSSPTVVMQSNPTSIIIHAGASATRTGSVSNSSSTTGPGAASVNTISAGAGEESEITQATQTGSIPATIVVSNGQVVASVLDQRFSVSIGKQSGDGYVVTISANNVTGPRTLLINLTGSSAVDFKTNSLNISLDGSPVAEASSLTQVLSPVAGDPARYAIVITSAGEQLLISIPHFSVHTLAFNPVPLTQIAAEVQNLLAVNAEILLVAALIITGLFAAAYKGRKRFYSIVV